MTLLDTAKSCDFFKCPAQELSNGIGSFCEWYSKIHKFRFQGGVIYVGWNDFFFIGSLDALCQVLPQKKFLGRQVANLAENRQIGEKSPIWRKKQV